MQGSIDRVRAVINGRTPDRAPLYDLLRNDAVISHFAGEMLTLENAPEVVYKAYEPALDATRPAVRMPERERTETDERGREVRHFRWTAWRENVKYPDVDAYAAAKRKVLDEFDPAWTPEDEAAVRERLGQFDEMRAKLGEVFFFPGGPITGLQGIMGEIGLEQFSYVLADAPDIIDELLEMKTVSAVRWIEHLPQDHGIEAVFAGDDIAFGSGPLLSPAWFDAFYMPRAARILSAYHKRDIKVLFHSDGNLNAILDGLVEAGIDGLNPIEVLAGMDVGEIHRRYPHLFLCGAIDVSQLLPLGTPEEVKDVVKRTIDAAGGRLMAGSTTELNNEVPLENYLALREAVFEHSY
jgi:hypothetical protein